MVTEPPPHRDDSHSYALDAQRVNERQNADHVHQRVDRAHLVEMNVIHCTTVHRGLHLSEATEGNSSPLLYTLGQRAPVDDSEQILEVAQGRIVFLAHGYSGAGDALIHFGAHRHYLRVQSHRRQGVAQRRLQMSVAAVAVQQRCHQHVSRDTHPRVDV